ncbi:hypothetical protein THAOC_25671, partial [Thalassiosira oceanica]
RDGVDVWTAGTERGRRPRGRVDVQSAFLSIHRVAARFRASRFSGFSLTLAQIPRRSRRLRCTDFRAPTPAAGVASLLAVRLQIQLHARGRSRLALWPEQEEYNIGLHTSLVVSTALRISRHGDHSLPESSSSKPRRTAP